MTDERDDEQPEPDAWGELLAEYACEQVREAEDYLPPEIDPAAFPLPEGDPFEEE